ncbi:ferritin family protein [Paenibacillus sp. A3]|uniref:ferritin family protein n=1 Tax=Paenibacillus sp. A3 TaxID=1337054 RepID=UPI0006D58B2A|nr:ferritin-like domain-containing protein [Paenibacillus sp. A3]
MAYFMEDLYVYRSYPPQPAGYGSDQQNFVLGMILQSISGEKQDELFYNYLIRQAPTEQQKQVIAGIRDDERKHNRMFRSMYTQLTGRIPAVTEANVHFEEPASYLDGIERRCSAS